MFDVDGGISLHNRIKLASAMLHRAGAPCFTGDVTKLVWQMIVERSMTLIVHTAVIICGSIPEHVVAVCREPMSDDESSGSDSDVSYESDESDMSDESDESGEFSDATVDEAQADADTGADWTKETVYRAGDYYNLYTLNAGAQVLKHAAQVISAKGV